MLDKTLSNMNTKEILKKGFEACGLHPWNVNTIDFNKVFKRIPYCSNKTVCGTELAPTSETCQNVDALKVFENVLEKEKLEVFKAYVNPIWTGKIEDKSLFQTWYSLKISNEVSFI